MPKPRRISRDWSCCGSARQDNAAAAAEAYGKRAQRGGRQRVKGGFCDEGWVVSHHARMWRCREVGASVLHTLRFTARETCSEPLRPSAKRAGLAAAQGDLVDPSPRRAVQASFPVPLWTRAGRPESHMSTLMTCSVNGPHCIAICVHRRAHVVSINTQHGALLCTDLTAVRLVLSWSASLSTPALIG